MPIDLLLLFLLTTQKRRIGDGDYHVGRGIQGTGHWGRDVKLRDVEQEVEQDVEHCDRRRRRTHSARTRTAWAELGSKDEGGCPRRRRRGTMNINVMS